MSSDAASKFYAKLNSDSDLLSRVQDAESVDNVVAMAGEMGFDFSADEFIEAGSKPLEGAELSDDDLDSVAGGAKVLSYSSNAPGCSLAPQTKISSCQVTIPPGCESFKFSR